MSDAPRDPAWLERAIDDRVLVGVCGGLARALGVPSLGVRIAFVVLGLAWGVGVLAYLALALLLDDEQAAPEAPLSERARANARALGLAIRERLGEVGEALVRAARERDLGSLGRQQIGLILVVGGVVAFCAALGLLDWLNPGAVIALVAVVTGYWLIVGRAPRD